MTTEALRSGFDLLSTIWPNQFADQDDLTRQMAGYSLALADMAGEAFIAACKLAMRRCKYFPKPVELEELAEEAVERGRRDRIILLDDYRARQAAAEGQRLLGPGQISEEQAAANRERLAALAAETLAAIRAGGEKVRLEGQARRAANRRAGRRLGHSSP